MSIRETKNMQTFKGMSKTTLKHLFSSGFEHFKISEGPNGHFLSRKCQEKLKTKLPASSYENVMAWAGDWISRLNGETEASSKAESKQTNSVTEQPASESVEAATNKPSTIIVDLCSDEDEDEETCESLDSLLDSESSLSKSPIIIHDDELGDIDLKDYADHVDGKLDLETLKNKIIAKRVSQTAIKQSSNTSMGRSKARAIRSKQKAKQDKLSPDKAQDEPTTRVLTDQSKLKPNEDRITITPHKAPKETSLRIRTYEKKKKVEQDQITTGKTHEEPKIRFHMDKSNISIKDKISITPQKTQDKATIRDTVGKAQDEHSIEVRSDHSKLKSSEHSIITPHKAPNETTIRVTFDKAQEKPTILTDQSKLKPSENRITIVPQKAQVRPTIRIRSDLLLNSNIPTPFENTQLIDGPVSLPAKSPGSTSSSGNRKRKDCDTTPENGQSCAKRPKALELLRTHPRVYLQLPAVQLLLEQVAHFADGQGNSQALTLINQLLHSLQVAEQKIWNAENLRHQ
ncbi:uncharacterized protein LOC108153099 [Drosophila miranda]|uniref:uncharacterized protein LOC108153099 n=1 Tax=Drosophila miranda TaxID=7229 RepID=UPI0007E68F14|nr:uncharacterized protein LOC108153099 [Drosophila miranda]